MQTVIGLFENARDAQRAAQQLMSEGFTADNVDVSVREGSSDSSGSDYSSANYSSDQNSAGFSRDNVAGSSSVTGTSDYSSGSDYKTDNLSGNYSTGGSSDYTTGSDYRTDNLSDNDLTGNTRTSSGEHHHHSGDGNSFGDKVSKFFKNLFGNDDDQAGRYTHVANRTGSVVTVYADTKDEAEKAADILDEYGAVDVDERAAEYGYTGSGAGYATGSGTDYNTTTGSNVGSDYTNDLTTDRMSDTSMSDRMTDISDRLTDDTNDRTNTGDTLKVIKEDVRVGKREVETGGVRLRSRVIERPVEETLRLREERVTVERNPVDRPATTADFQNFKEGEIEMTERAEVADVSKEARVVEEIRLSKEVNERTETINETARDTEVDVENLSKTDTTRKYNKKKDL